MQSVNLNRLKFSIYGRPKTGKTRLVCTFPKPMLLIGAEDGTDSVKGVKGLDFVQLERTEELFEIINGPLKEGKYRSVGLDTATKLRDMRISEIKGLPKTVVQKSFGFAGRDEWIKCSQDLKEIFSALLDLPRVMDLNIAIIAQEGNRAKEEGNNGDDRITPEIGGAVGKSLGDYIDAECSYICQTMIREEIVTSPKKIGGQIINLDEKTGKKEYAIRIGPHETYITGFRINPDRRDPIPDFVVNPTFDKIAEIIKGPK